MGDNYQHMLANRPQVRYEFSNTKNMEKKFAKIDTSSICCQLFASAVQKHQLEFANFRVSHLHLQDERPWERGCALH